MNQEQFKEHLKLKNINVTKEQLNQFEIYFSTLVDYNERVNLTSITDREGVYLKHFFDSLTVLTEYELNEGSNLCDVGAGAGFPSIPLKIIRPDLNVTIIDALGKRIDFLNFLIKELNLEGIQAKHARAEEYAKEHRETFDVVTGRAVARLNILAELCMPLVKVKGEFIALKGSSGEEEVSEAKRAITQLGGRVNKTIDFELPFEGGQRSLIIIEKNVSTPLKYPRNYGQIKKKPL